jgi:hypothetical protein
VNWRTLAASLFLLICCVACADRARVNTNCIWIARPHASLDADALFAEDLAIRYADAHRGHRSGHYKGLAEYERAREQCMAALFDAVARGHGVSTDDVRGALTHRRTAVDAAVIGSFFVLYGIVAAVMAGWIFRSFSLTHMWTAVAAALVASVPVGVAGWISGGLWSATLEMIRIGNDHVSYRGERAPWARHQIEFLTACIVVFWLAAAVRHRFIRATRAFQKYVGDDDL